MILKKIIMNNFGVYAGINQFDFHGEKSVVLIGGMNGCGKTTFLEAVLLGLYGSNSFAYTESKYKTYGQYLRSYVNKADGSLKTYVEIEFSMDYSDKEIYFIHRQWDANGSQVREKISVEKNGVRNVFLTENWPMFIENILPSALSSFYFFDGEKIAELAVENSNQKMNDSIKALLGVSVLDLLESDLGRIITKLSNQCAEDQNLKYLEQLRQKRDTARQAFYTANDIIERTKENIDKLKMKLEKKKIEYAIKGGDVADKRHDLIKQRSEAVATMGSHQNALLELATDAMPLMLVIALLKDIQKQGEAEQLYRTSRLATQKVNSLYEEFLKKYPNASGEVQEFIHFVKEESKSQKEVEIYHISDSTLYQVSHLNENGLRSAKEKALSHIACRKDSQSKIDEIDNHLAVEIDEKVINKIFKQIKALEMEIATEEVELDLLNQKRTTLHSASMIADVEFSKAVEQTLSSLETMDDDNRTIKYAHMAIEIMKKYKIRLQQSKIEILAKTMTECYKQLANKKNLIVKIMINPKTLELHYLNSKLEEVEKKSLSAGEKQLMVICLLWALAICSKKKLPVIIDTPLSRLDSFHREALITTYFPNASDQTIILSTDSEINEKYYLLMKPNVGDEFTLVYDDEQKKTTIQRGYLFSGGKASCS